MDSGLQTIARSSCHRVYGIQLTVGEVMMLLNLFESVATLILVFVKYMYMVLQFNFHLLINCFICIHELRVDWNMYRY